MQDSYVEEVRHKNGYVTRVRKNKNTGEIIEKECRQCKQLRPLNDFHKEPRGYLGRMSRCKEDQKKNKQNIKKQKEDNSYVVTMAKPKKYEVVASPLIWEQMVKILKQNGIDIGNTQ